MHIYHDDDEWEVVTYHRPCTTCNDDLRKFNGVCNGSSGYGMVRRSPAEVAKIKARKQKEREDAILADGRRHSSKKASLTITYRGLTPEAWAHMTKLAAEANKRGERAQVAEILRDSQDMHEAAVRLGVAITPQADAGSGNRVSRHVT